MMQNTEVDRMREADVAQIAAIEQSSFADPWSEDAFRAELVNPRAHYLVLRRGEEVLAYGGFWQVMEEGYITNIAVRPEARRQGLGDRLMAHLRQAAQEIGIRRMTLEVRVSNLPAQRLYEKHGFHSVGKRPGYYPDGEDAYIYWTGEC